MTKSILSCSLFFVFLIVLVSCHNIGQKVGEGSSEFFHGVKQGINQTLQCQVDISTSLKQKGIEAGKFDVRDTSGNIENVLSIYLIFNKDFNQNITAKVFDKDGKEYGRSTMTVAGKVGEAKFFDFIFDKRTDIESKSKIVLE